MSLYILGFIFPWFLFLLFSNKNQYYQLFITGAFSSMLAFIIDVVEKNFRWWSLVNTIPLCDIEFFFNIGYYPVESMFLIQYLPESKTGQVIYILSAAGFNTLLEFTLLKTGWASYSNGWNLGLTYIIYAVTLTIVVIHSAVYSKYFKRISVYRI